MRHLVAFFLIALLAGCAEKTDSALAGYVEADYLYLAPQDGGVISILNVQEGDAVKASDVLFELDPERATHSAAQAKAAADRSAALAADKGALDQQIIEAEAALALARQNFSRSNKLLKQGVVSKERYDSDLMNLRSSEARLDAAKAQKTASQQEWQSADAAARLAEKRLADHVTRAPADGVIERVYRRPGEVVGPGEPVLALLPPANLKLRFYAPETLLSSLAIGAPISFSCDGCPASEARISYIASEPQFTPPVIYSVDEREKLVFLVEARPAAPEGLRPGQPVTIAPVPAMFAARP
jgi:HlyD family secretion protein